MPPDSTPATAPCRAAHPPWVDAHLVMNALNQLAALQLSQQDPENPIVFVLSDYLREALSTLEAARLPLAQEVRLMETHLTLHACVAHTAIELEVSGAAGQQGGAARGTLAEMALWLFKTLRPRTHSHWKLTVVLDPVDAGERDRIRCTMTLHAPGSTQGLDAAAASRELAQWDLAESGIAVSGQAIVLPQRTPDEVTLLFSMPMQ